MEGNEKIREIDTIDPHWTFRSCKLGNTIIRFVNRLWEVKLPPNCGTAKVIGGGFNCTKVIIDLSKVTFSGIDATLPVADGKYWLSLEIVGGVKTFEWKLRRNVILRLNGPPGTASVARDDAVPL